MRWHDHVFKYLKNYLIGEGNNFFINPKNIEGYMMNSIKKVCFRSV